MSNESGTHQFPHHGGQIGSYCHHSGRKERGKGKGERVIGRERTDKTRKGRKGGKNRRGEGRKVRERGKREEVK